VAGGEHESGERTIIDKLNFRPSIHITQYVKKNTFEGQEKSFRKKLSKSRTKTAYPNFRLPSNHFLNLIDEQTPRLQVFFFPVHLLQNLAC
jgi:hypothetical protein